MDAPTRHPGVLLMVQLEKNTIAVRISREMALDYGMVDPTPEEDADRAERLIAWHAESVANWATYAAAKTALAALTGELERIVLDLHAAPAVENPVCEGCDFSGFDADAPDWPCRTVAAIARHHGIALPTNTIYDEPRSEAPTYPPCEECGLRTVHARTCTSWREPFSVRDAFVQVVDDMSDALRDAGPITYPTPEGP